MTTITKMMMITVMAVPIYCSLLAKRVRLGHHDQERPRS